MRAIERARGLAHSWSTVQAGTALMLLLACLGLSGIIAAELSTSSLAVADPAADPPPGTRAKGAASEAPVAFSLPPLRSFASVNERPLFSQTRRPAPQGEDFGPWSSFVLAGIIISPDSREALILHGKPPTVAHVQEGQDVEGWLITSILPDRVVFRAGTTEHELRLLDAVKPDPNAPKVPNVNRARPGQ